MMTDWFRPARPLDAALTAEPRFSVASDSLFFDGHFPGRPIVPGIALLGMVRETARRSLAGVPLPLAFRRVRFRALIEGEATLVTRLTATTAAAGTEGSPAGPAADAPAAGFPFEVRWGDQLAADGLLVQAPCGAVKLPPFGPDAVEESRSIEDFLPHRGRMRVAASILRVQPGLCEVEAEALPSWPLAFATGADSVVLLELLAQTAAAMTGWEERHTPGGGGRDFLVGSRFFTSSSAEVPFGTLCRSTVHSLRHRDNYRVFQGLVSAPDGTLLAEGELQAFRA